MALIGVAPPNPATDTGVGSIYALMCSCHPEKGLRYVGQTKRSVAKRVSEHVWEARAARKKNAELPVHLWMRKHGVENVEVVILEEDADVNSLDHLETEWIRRVRSFGDPEGLNLTPGGASAPVSDEVRTRMSESAKRRWDTETPDQKAERVKRLRRIAGKGVPKRRKTEAERDHLRRVARERGPVTEQTRERMREAWKKHKTLPLSGPGEANGRATITNEAAVSIYEAYLAGESQASIARRVGVTHGIVANICHGRTWTHVTGAPKSKGKDNG